MKMIYVSKIYGRIGCQSRKVNGLADVTMKRRKSKYVSMFIMFYLRFKDTFKDLYARTLSVHLIPSDLG